MSNSDLSEPRLRLPLRQAFRCSMAVGVYVDQLARVRLRTLPLFR